MWSEAIKIAIIGFVLIGAVVLAFNYLYGLLDTRLDRFYAKLEKELLDQYGIDFDSITESDWSNQRQHFEQQTRRGKHSAEWLKNVKVLAELRGFNPNFSADQQPSPQSRSTITKPPTDYSGLNRFQRT